METKIYPKHLGTHVELQCITRLVELGCTVSTPVGEYARYDFIIDFKNRLLKVQCKKATKRLNDVIIIKTCSSHLSATKGAPKRKYSKDEIDYFATFYNGECYLVPIELCPGFEKRFSLRENSNRLMLLRTFAAPNVLGNSNQEMIYEAIEKSQKKEIFTCTKCGRRIKVNNSVCAKCKREDELRAKKPTKEKLESLLKTISIVAILKYLKIGKTTLKKWLDEYGIDKMLFVSQGRKKRGCKRYSKDGELEETYEDYYDVIKEGYIPRQVYRCCCGWRHTYKEKIWKWEDEETECSLSFASRSHKEIGILACRKRFGKRVGCFDKNGTLIKQYDSIRQAEEDGFSNVCVCKCCKGVMKSYRGFVWHYL